MRPPQGNERGVRIRRAEKFPIDDPQAELDIIAIHGLDTNSSDTWTWKSKGSDDVNWLSDPLMLPSQVGTGRIFICDWPADLFQPSDLIQNRIEELARLLLIAIHDVRGENKKRPLVFIASCLGGIVLMKTLVMADLEYVHIQRATRGIVFLATPFRGTAFHDVAAWAESALKYRASFKGQQVSSLLEYTKRSTFDLGELVNSFTQIFRERDHCKVVTFYEKKPAHKFWIRRGKLLVDKDSATLDIVQNPVPLERHHRTMNKFSGPDDNAYIIVAGKVKEIIQHIRENTPLAKADAWIQQERYTSERLRIERLSGDLLPMDKCYVNLAIVDTVYTRFGRVRPPRFMPSLLARLKVEVPKRHMLVKLRNIFRPHQMKGRNGERPRRVLIQGRAGVGKTTLCKKIIHEFVQGMWNDIFDRVLWIPLRNLKSWKSSSYDFEELFHREYFFGNPHGRSYAKALSHALGDSYGKTLFILDGFDEVLHEWDRGETKYEFIQSLFNQPYVIITSRPHGRLSDQLPDIEQELETIGFNSIQVKEYIQNTFTGSTGSIRVAVESFLQRYQLLQDLVRIPVQLDALCYTWGISTGSAPQTMTAIYQNIEIGLWRKDLPKLEELSNAKPIKQGEMRDASKYDVELRAGSVVYFLEKLAFSAMLDKKVDFNIEYLNTIQKSMESDNIFVGGTLPRLSFLRTPDSSLDECDRNYYFIHLTYQEYFAARYFVRRWKDHKLLGICGTTANQDSCASDFLRRNKYTYYYEIMWRFVAGLLDAEGENEVDDFFQVIEKEPRDLLGVAHQRLVLHCLGEITIETSLLRSLEHKLSDWLLFEYNFTEDSRLVKEADFPDAALRDALFHSSTLQRERILNLVMSRPYVSYRTLEVVLPLVEIEPRWTLVHALCDIITKHRVGLPSRMSRSMIALLRNSSMPSIVKALKTQENLSIDVLQDIAHRLEDYNSQVRNDCVEVLKAQTSLPNEVLGALVTQLGHKGGLWRGALEVLEDISDLPDEILGDIVWLLNSDDKEKRVRASIILRRQTKPSGDDMETAQPVILKYRVDPSNTDWDEISNESSGTLYEAESPLELFDQEESSKPVPEPEPEPESESEDHDTMGSAVSQLINGMAGDAYMEGECELLVKESLKGFGAWCIEDDMSYCHGLNGVEETKIDDPERLKRHVDEVQKMLWDKYGVKCVWDDGNGESKCVHYKQHEVKERRNEMRKTLRARISDEISNISIWEDIFDKNDEYEDEWKGKQRKLAK
ncbi:hypothetical protein F4811DRAFT_521214 [Daldinia bambusicola]|nr:hypothetical protein F4811DRAFT_521214 [Daldinia bambusicola]